MSIKKSLQSNMVIVASIPLFIFAVIMLVTAFNNYMSVSKVAAISTARNNEKGIEAQLSTQIAELEALANNNDILTLLLKKYNDPELDLTAMTQARTDIHDLLFQTSASFGQNVIYSVYDIDGTLVFSSVDSLVGSSSDYIKDISPVTDSTLVNSTLSLNGTSTAIHVLTPVVLKEKYHVGTLVASIAPDYFNSFVSAESQSYLLDSASNSLLGISFSDTDIQREAVYYLTHFDGSADDSCGTILVRNGLQISLYGYSIMPTYHWIYLTQYDMNVYQSLSRSIPILLLCILVILIIITLISSSRLARKFCDPIYDLKDKMLQASQGDLNVHCKTDSKNEFGELSQHFNDMMQIISNNYAELNETKECLEESQKELQNSYQQIEQLAYTDALTGLANRTAFMAKANELFHSSNSFTKRAILFLDLDNFKNVNDTLGHDYGDLLLKQISAQLSSYMAEDDLLARTGGDEFLVLRNQVSSTDELDQFAANLVSITSHPFDLDDEQVHVSLSVGVAIFPQNGLTVTELIKNADIAMYSAKTAGKSGYRFFNSSMEDAINHKNEIEDVLRNAITNRDIYLVYQPQCDITTGRITGCEALMRIRNDYLGQLSPAEFIPIAEESGVIRELGLWALKRACDFNKQLLDAGYGPITMSVNVSIEQLKDPEFLSKVEDVLRITGLAPRYLELEVTESVLMHSFDRNAELLQKLREKGIRIALDDFGTGYSSFNYLTKMPIDTLKMDKSFVDNICTNPKDCYVAETIITLAHKLNISVVAEGVEESDQLHILQENSCDILQGYLFSKPLPDEHYRSLLEINHS